MTSRRPRTLSAVCGTVLLAVSILEGVSRTQPVTPRASTPATSQPARRPNVVLILTDDQGYGDLGVHGNPWIETPHLDQLARDGVQFRSFYAAPVCSPTRASLLTGRYHYRAGVVDTYLGRSLMHADETTIAEVLAAAGYRTGIFGKWHLGDNYPLRALDQGFQESLTLNGGGIGQPSDPPGGERYVDPMLRRNGRWVQAKGYVSDVITDEAIAFMHRHRQRPFFAYLAFNAPHTPLQPPADKYAKYRRSLPIDGLLRPPHVAVGHAIGTGHDADTTAKVYAMVENIDDNVGRLLSTLRDLDLANDTIVIFMTDNGPQQPRYNAGMLQRKGTVYEGGIRVPLFVRWPGRLPGGRTLDPIAAHVDITPTVLDMCGVARPARVRFDGRSVWPLLERGTVAPDRTLFFQWHRGDAPQRGRAFAARSQRYKLAQPQGYGDTSWSADAPLLLFDMERDPLEERNIASAHPDIVDRLRREYETWFGDVTSGRDYTDAGVARIAIGAPQENPVRLTRQDWRGPNAGWTPGSSGYWQVHVQRRGAYTIALRFQPLAQPGLVTVTLGGLTVRQDAAAGATAVTFDRVRLSEGDGTLLAHVTQGDAVVGPLDAVMTRLQ